MLRFAPHIAIGILIGPIIFGLLSTLLPAFGYFPALGGHNFGWRYVSLLIDQPGLTRSSLISFATGLFTTAISLTIVAAFFAAWSGTKLFTRIQHLVSPLLAIPHAATAFGLAFMIAPSGWIMRILSPEITGFTRPPDWQILNDPYGFTMMAGLVVKEVPFIFLVTLAALPQVRAKKYLMTATSLGYGWVSAFIFTVWPLLYRQIKLAVFAVIAYSSSVVDVALILGPTNPAPLAVRLVTWMNDPDLTMRFQASAGAVLQLLISMGALVTWIFGEKVLAFIFRKKFTSGYRFKNDSIFKIISWSVILVSALLVFCGLGVLGIWSVAGYWQFPDALPKSFTLRIWTNQIGVVITPFYITLMLGVISTGSALALTLACLEREVRMGKKVTKWSLRLIYLPLIIPQPAFVFGLQMFFLSIGLSASFFALVLVHLVFVLPYVFLSLSDPWRAFDQRHSISASSMGISKNEIFWRIRLPILLRAVLAAAAIGFAVSIGQYLPTLLIGAGRWPTLTTEAVALASGGDRRVIGVYAFLQMGLPFIGFFLAAMVPSILHKNRYGMRVTS